MRTARDNEDLYSVYLWRAKGSVKVERGPVARGPAGQAHQTSYHQHTAQFHPRYFSQIICRYDGRYVYCMSKKKWPILWSNLLYNGSLLLGHTVLIACRVNFSFVDFLSSKDSCRWIKKNEKLSFREIGVQKGNEKRKKIAIKTGFKASILHLI